MIYQYIIDMVDILSIMISKNYGAPGSFVELWTRKHRKVVEGRISFPLSVVENAPELQEVMGKPEGSEFFIGPIKIFLRRERQKPKQRGVKAKLEELEGKINALVELQKEERRYPDAPPAKRPRNAKIARRARQHTSRSRRVKEPEMEIDENERLLVEKVSAEKHEEQNENGPWARALQELRNVDSSGRLPKLGIPDNPWPEIEERSAFLISLETAIALQGD